MIRKYNQKLICKAIGNFFLGSIATVVCWLFFRIAWIQIVSSFSLNMEPYWTDIFSYGSTLLVWISGFVHFRSGADHYGFGDSDLYFALPSVSGGAAAAEFYSARVTVPAFLLSQVFLAGPLRVLKAISQLRSKISPDRNLENDLTRVLQLIEKDNRWESIQKYRAHKQEVTYLIQMEKVQFSPRKGSIRAF